ncbi:BTAD domain-containing putative transcriptional regulator [Streptomyces sp. NPDC059618]|uniref:AfsR/SARP family transcriptional regulator n=1 Tax=Streptomyces sp. NPDC059618 TaxID=3346887 RepID=UPI00369D1FF7
MTVLGLAAPAPPHPGTARTTEPTGPTGATEPTGAAGEIEAIEAATEFRLLGPVVVYDRGTGTGIAPAGPKQRALLAALVVHAGRQLSVDRLVEELWGDRPPANAQSALHTHVARLRRLLPARGHEWISTLPTGYRLRLGRASTDVARFTRLSGQGRATAPQDPQGAARLLGQALALWQGEALQDSCHGPLCTAEADRLEEQRLTTLEALYEANLNCGRYAETVCDLERLTAAHPLRERLYDLLMVALYRCGRQSEALGVYERARRRLVATLGVEPGPALRCRLDAVLNHCPTLAVSSSHRPDLAAEAARLQARIDRLVADQADLLRRVREQDTVR